MCAGVSFHHLRPDAVEIPARVGNQASALWRAYDYPSSPELKFDLFDGFGWVQRSFLEET